MNAAAPPLLRRAMSLIAWVSPLYVRCFFCRTAAAEILRPEFLAFFRRHQRELFLHLFAPPVVAPAVAVPPSSPSPQEDMREDEKPDRLPEAQHRAVEELGDERIPEAHDNEAKDERRSRANQNHFDDFHRPRVFHRYCLL